MEGELVAAARERSEPAAPTCSTGERSVPTNLEASQAARTGKLDRAERRERSVVEIVTSTATARSDHRERSPRSEGALRRDVRLHIII